MRNEAMIHFHKGTRISPGVHLRRDGHRVPDLLSQAAARLDSQSPGRSAAGFCAYYFDLIEDLVPPPPRDWPAWRFFEWDQWFGRVNGTFLVDLDRLSVTQFPIYRVSPADVVCDLSGIPGRLRLVDAAE